MKLSKFFKISLGDRVYITKLIEIMKQYPGLYDRELWYYYNEKYQSTALEEIHQSFMEYFDIDNISQEHIYDVLNTIINNYHSIRDTCSKIGDEQFKLLEVTHVWYFDILNDFIPKNNNKSNKTENIIAKFEEPFVEGSFIYQEEKEENFREPETPSEVQTIKRESPLIEIQQLKEQRKFPFRPRPIRKQKTVFRKMEASSIFYCQWDNCNFICSDSMTLDKHLSSVHFVEEIADPSLICRHRLCESLKVHKFTQSSYMYHLKKHLFNESFICTDCDFTSTHSSEFRIHRLGEILTQQVH